MNKLEEMRARALECKDAAVKAPNEGIRTQYEALAAMWEWLASERESLLQVSGEPV